MARIPYNSPFNPYVPPWPKRQPEQWVHVGPGMLPAYLGPPPAVIPPPPSHMLPRPGILGRNSSR